MYHLRMCVNWAPRRTRTYVAAFNTMLHTILQNIQIYLEYRGGARAPAHYSTSIRDHRMCFFRETQQTMY